MRRAQLNLALLVVAAGLGAAVFFSVDKDEPGPPLTALKPDAVTRIHLAHPGAPAIRLAKQDGKWRLVEPVAAEADEFEVGALTALADKEAKDKVEGGNAADFGLEPPKYTLTLDDTAIEVGTTEPLQYRRYVRVNGVVSLIEDPPSAALDKDYADLVAKALFPPDAEIARIELPKLTLARDGDAWAVTPADPKATADAMQKLADGWKNARSMWNESGAPGAKVKGEGVKVTLKDGTVREFVVAAREPQLKLHRPDLGVNLVLSKALADELLTLPQPPPPEEKKEETKDEPGAQ